MASIIANSDQLILEDVRKKRFEKYGYGSRAEYIHQLEKVIKLDPLTLGEGFKGKKLGMILDRLDKTVPTKNQEVLRKLWKPQTFVQYHSGHLCAILKTWLFKQHEVIKFFMP